MARSKPPARPTDGQLAILRVLWEAGPATVREVHEALPSALRRGYTTTLKLMQIMAEKGLVRRDESQRSHVYTAVASEEQMQGTLVGELLNKAFGGSAAKLALRALEHQPAPAAEVAQIRRLLQRLQEGEDAQS
jgi:predicted transcriptional regulator